MKTTQIDNKHYIKAKVVMLPSKNHNTILYLINNKLVLDKGQDTKYKPIPQHLYLLSNEEIKKGDWFLADKTNDLLQVQKPERGYEPTGKKIIATTNPELWNVYDNNPNANPMHRDISKPMMPKPTDEFLQEWIKNPVDKINVEYEEYIVQPYFEKKAQYNDIRVKINPDNTINCSFIKDDLELTGKEIVDYCKQYEGTDKYNVAMLAIEFGYQLALKNKEN